LAAARDIRETFRRMAMNDEETVALIVGGHTFGKTHGAVPAAYVGPEPEGAPLEQQGLGWKVQDGREGIYTSGLEGAWTNHPTTWDNGFLDNLFKYEWTLTESPAGGKQWTPTDPAAQDAVPDARDPNRRHAPMMLTTDIALKVDPIYRPIAERFYHHPEELADAFAKAWYKLLHRDMGPPTRYLGPWVPEPQPWQDPVPPVDHPLIDAEAIDLLKRQILASGLPISRLVATAWASASTFRGTDLRGGANGARIRLAPQKDWEVNNPPELAKTLDALERIRQDFNRSRFNGQQVSMADLIVLGGAAAVEEAARRAGVPVTVPFVPGRTDATPEFTDVESFAVLEPLADGFRNYYRPGFRLPPEHALVDRAHLLTLTAPEMTVLVGGLRVLNANWDGSPHGVWTDNPETLTPDFFVTATDMGVEWTPSALPGLYEGRDRSTGALRWTGTAVDLVFGANAQLRAIAEVYAADDGREKFLHDFVAAWNKVMMLDRFDVVT
jgi:catalase-peroxidase